MRADLLFGLLLSLGLLLPSFASAQTCICLRCAFGSHKNYVAPSGSMAPTLRPGDCFVARRLFDDLDQPDLGNIITFRHPRNGVEFVKRIVAKGGDTIQMIDGQVWLNGEMLKYEPLSDDSVPFELAASGGLPLCKTPVKKGENCARSQWRETLPNGVSYNVLDISNVSTDNTVMFDVPEGHVFVMGDNRDNSLDSRIPQSANGIGFVSPKNIIGIVESDPK